MHKHAMPPEDLLSTEALTPQNSNIQAEVPHTGSSTEKPIKKANKSLILTILTAFMATSAILGYILFLQLTGTKNLINAQNLAALIKIPVPKSTPYPDQSPSPSPMISDWQTVKGEISSFEVPQDWKSFKDTINGVSFRYPNNWFLNTSKLNKDRSVLYLNDHEFVVPEDTEFNAAFEVSFNTIPAYSYPTSEDLFYDYFEKSLEDLIERYKRNNFKSAVFVQDLVIDNHKANQVYGFHGPGMLEGKYFRKTFIQLDNRVLIFAHNESDHKQIYDQVLSTFKFTEKVDTSNWQTHTDETYKYSFQYPQEYEIRDFLSSTPNNENTFVYLAVGPKGLDNNAFTNIVKISKNSVEDEVAQYKLLFQDNQSFEFIVENKISLSGIEGREVVYRYSHNGSSAFHKTWFFRVGEITYRFSISDYEHKTVEQIAKTIKFIN